MGARRASFGMNGAHKRQCIGGGQRWPFRGRDDQWGGEQECEERGAAMVAMNARQVATVAMDTGQAAAAAMDAGRVVVVE